MQQFYRLLRTDTAFEPDDLQCLEEAYAKVLLALELTSPTEPLKEVIAKYIIEAARTGEKDPDLMCEYALMSLGIPTSTGG